MPEDMPDRMPEDMSDRMPEDLPVTKCINVMVGITRSKVFFFSGGYHVYHDLTSETWIEQNKHLVSSGDGKLPDYTLENRLAIQEG